MCNAKMKIAHLKGEISSAESYGQQMQVRAYDLEQERDQLKVLNADFSEAIKSASDTFRRLDEQGAHIIGEEDVFLNLHVLYEKLLIINPNACLAEIQ